MTRSVSGGRVDQVSIDAARNAVSFSVLIFLDRERGRCSVVVDTLRDAREVSKSLEHFADNGRQAMVYACDANEVLTFIPRGLDSLI